jgi:Mrp family chromosome partitioning ATPase/capsular polysaccharide biosynthesis protein
MDNIETEPSLFASLWRFKWYIVAAAVLAAAVGFSVSMLQTTLYQATGQVLLNDPRSSGGAAADLGFYIDPGRYVRNQAEVMESPQVATRASEILGGSLSPLEVQSSTSATASSDIDALTVQGTRPTADGSVEVVNAVVQAYGEVVQEGISSEVDDTIATLEQSKLDVNVTIAEMDAQLATDPDNAAAEAQRNAALAQLVSINTRIEQLSTNAALYGSGIQLYVPPTTPSSPIQPRPARNAAIAMVLGVIAAGAWAWWRSEQDQRADDRNIPARILDAPLLAVVPEYSDVGATAPNPTVTSPESGAAEAYHFAVSSLGFALEQIDGTSIVVTSAAPADGKSVTALNIAIAAAQDGRNPLLIDADERARGLTRLAGLNGEVGITDIGNGSTAANFVSEWAMADDTVLPFVAAGSELDGSTAGYFRSNTFRRALPTLATDRDILIIDAPPVMSAAETTDLAAQADGVVLVVLRDTPIRDLEDARQRLAMSGTPILGYIFNRAKGRSGGYGYGYGYGYGRDSDS